MTDISPDQLRLEEIVDAMPKIELHTHLAGSVPMEVFKETAARHGIALSNPENPYHFEGELSEFLVIYEQVAESFQTPEDIYKAAYESLAEEVRQSNLRYREIHFSPTIGTPVGYEEAIAALAEGAEKAKADYGVDSRIIIAIYRSQGQEVAEKLVETMIAKPHPAVVGLGIEADENLGPVEWFDRSYAMAREAGFGVTAHAGERVNLAEVMHAVETQGCRRIDHGYALATDRAAAMRLKELDVHIATTWLSAAVHHGGDVNNPVRTLIDWGLDVSISSDDPGIGLTTLRASLLDAAAAFQLDTDFLIRQNYSQLAAAWLPAEQKTLLRSEITAALAAVGVTTA